MKAIFYSFILLFTVTFVYAQKNVSYVSFFPPAHVVHSNVHLKQNTSSFKPATASAETPYANQKGSLILGAAPDAEIVISSLTVTGGSSKIGNFDVSNIIKVASSGTITTVNIGTAPTACDGYNSQDLKDNCYALKTFISANKIIFTTNLPNSGLTVNMRVAGETSITHPIGLAKFFLPSLNDNHKLKWVRLRINGTSECRRYLVRYTGTEPEDNCNQPTIPAVSPTPANNYWPSTPYL